MTAIPILIAQTAESDLAKGASIAIAGLLIVFIALILISLFIAALPRVLGFVEAWLPEEEGHGHSSVETSHPESFVPDDDAVLAAIGFVLHTEMQKQLTNEHSSESRN